MQVADCACDADAEFSAGASGLFFVTMRADDGDVAALSCPEMKGKWEAQ